MRRFISFIKEGSGFDMRIFCLKDKTKISPWHDIPLYEHQNIFPAVIEISRDSVAKLEVCLSEEHNPIKQDTRKNPKTGEKELRNYAKFPLFNYGMLPQTWENPFLNHGEIGLKGDGDPLDILELGTRPIPSGSLVSIKVLGALCLIDQGEVDWKILTININDPLFSSLSSPEDLETHFPGKVSSIIEWLETIKVYDGKPRNKVLPPVLGPEETLKIISEGHSQYKELMKGAHPGHNLFIKAKSI